MNAFFVGSPAGGQIPGTFTQQTTTSRIGTYGQISLGQAAQVRNTGWLGFAASTIATATICMVGPATPASVTSSRLR
jgi:hypothetical protein